MTRREFMAALGAFAAASPVLARLIEAPKSPAIPAAPKTPPRPVPGSSHFAGVSFVPKNFEARYLTDYTRLHDVFETHYTPEILLRRVAFSLTGTVKPEDVRALHRYGLDSASADIRVVGQAGAALLSFEFHAFIERLSVHEDHFSAEGFVLPDLDGAGFQLKVA